MQKLTFERVHDIAPIQALYRTVYPDRSAEKFDWLISQNPAGPALSYCAIESDSKKVIGCVQVIPQEVSIDSRSCRVAQLIDGMVLKEYRGQKIFNHLTKVVIEDLQRQFEFVIGFPNKLSIGPCLNAGFRVLTPMSTFVLPLSGRYIGRRVSSNRFLQSLAAAAASPLVAINRNMQSHGREIALRPLDSPAPDFTAPSIPQPVAAVRSPHFVQWRFFEAPTPTYQFLEAREDGDRAGYIVVRDRTRDRELVDLVLPDNFPAMIGALRALAAMSRAAGCESVQIQCPPTNYSVPALRKAGFREMRHTADVIILPFTDRARAFDPRQYFITHADSDWI